MQQPTLFVDDEVTAPPLRPSASAVWHEVPQARFLSWSPAMQRAYCAARDRDGATRASTDAERQFLLARAESYEHD